MLTDEQMALQLCVAMSIDEGTSSPSHDVCVVDASDSHLLPFLVRG
jgi:hypothetical protein